MTNSLIAPTDDYSDVFRECISNLRNAKRQNFVDNEDFFIDAATDFDTRIVARKLFQTPQIDSVKGVITKADMVYLYNGKLSKLGHTARDFYDRWRAIPEFGQCPLCGVRTVSTLDHYLPKDEFPVYSIYPMNLIPACRDCNTDKLSEIATSHSEETIHPYFDVLADDYYLHGTVIQTRPASIVFHINAPAIWGSDLQARLNNHFRIFKLNRLYVTLAAQELSNIRFRMQQRFDSGGANAVRSFLFEELETRNEANKNSWQTAMYRAMHDSVWLHSNGFLF